jgi:hypothetical protein
VSLERDQDLPGPMDDEAMLPPGMKAFARPCKGRNLWLWYTFDDGFVLVVAVSRARP